MRKRFLPILLALCMLFTLFPAAVFAAENDMANFKKVNTYKSGTFQDVSASAWYAGNVQTAYELDLMQGASANSFEPNGKMTIAEALAIACRLHSIYETGKADFVQGSPWYQVYVDYAVENNIITKGQYSNYNANATRRQFAAILAKALPEKALAQKNTIGDNSIPDVKTGAANYDQIYLLYRAGVLTGNDAKGTFTPDATIERSAVAAIVSRMAMPEQRQSITLGSQTEDVKVTLNRSSLTLKEDRTATLTATVTPSNAANKTVTWSSSNSSVASVKNGVVTANRKGTATITATAANGAKDTCRVTVTADDDEYVEVRSVSVSPAYLTLEEGETETLDARISPSDATDKDVTWKSSNTRVATVSSSGKVTAVAPGSARITATAENGKSDYCSVTVEASTDAPDFSTPELGKNYGPMTVTAYYTSGGVQYVAYVTDLEFTKATLQSNGDVRLDVTIQGTNSGPNFYVGINLYHSSGRLLDSDYVTASVGANQEFAVQRNFNISASALEDASRIEFFSFSGHKAVDGINQPEIPAEPEIDPEKEAALAIGERLTDVFESGLESLTPVQEYMMKVPENASNPHGASNLVLWSIDGLKSFRSDISRMEGICGDNPYWTEIRAQSQDLVDEVDDAIALFEKVGESTDPTVSDIYNAQKAYNNLLKGFSGLMNAAKQVVAGL